MLSVLIPKVVLGVALISVIGLGVRAPAPQRVPGRRELRVLVVGGLGLYLIGAIASLGGHRVLCALVLGSGICVSSVAVWLSRGHDEGLSDPEAASRETPPPDPEPVDWAAFERQLAEFTRSREPAGRTPISSGAL